MRKKQKVIFGKILSDKMDKTVVVAITRLVPHPMYGKVVRRVSKFKAHDEKNEARTGDWVKIIHTRPRSKQKSWVIAQIVGRKELDSV